MFSKYLKEVADITELAGEKGFGSIIIKGLKSLCEEFAKLETSVTAEDLKERTKTELEEMMKGLSESAEAGQKGLCLGKLRQLRDQIRLLLDQGSRKK